jgi:two-component system chemotaxis sensor kinase CheA
MDIDFEALQQTFFQDAEEHLEQIDDALAQLMAGDPTQEPMGAIFRSVHTLKGDSGALGFEAIERLLHCFETTLDSLRGSGKPVTTEAVDMINTVIGVTERLVTAARDGAAPPQDLEDAFSLLEAFSSRDSDSAQPVADTQSSDECFGLFDTEQCVDRKATRPFFGDFLVERGLLTPAQVVTALDEHRSRQPLLGSILLKSGLMSAEDILTTLGHQQECDHQFGMAAVQLGLFEESAVTQAIAKQRRLRPSLRATIVELGFLDKETVKSEFERFAELYPSTTPDGYAESDAVASLSNVVQEQPTADFVCDSDLLCEFIEDAQDHLNVAEEQLLVIENDPGNGEAINAIYRAFHTIKGLASFLGLEDTRNLAHQAESMLNLARDKTLPLVGDAFEVSLSSVDALKKQVQFAKKWLSTRGALEVDPDLRTLLASIDAVSKGDKPELPKKTSTETVQNAGAGEIATAAPSPVLAAHVSETIKVDRERLDKLINVIGELVIGQAMLESEVAHLYAKEGVESVAMAQLNNSVRDLQELSLSMRMVPVGAVFHKMARVVRDLGSKLNKEIRFSTEGDETELDKTVVDQIGDPLLHMVRNAADHGIETPQQRIAAGKPPQGQVTLRAYHQGGNIFIEIEDDGRGLDRDLLVRKAVERGIVQAGESLSDQEAYNLIFAPGFSTAAQVTDVSGRGVGMDVVRRNVEALQGSVSVSSRKGFGSKVVIRLPLTLAILDGLSVRVIDDVYIVPILSVVESFSPRPHDIKRVLGRGEVVTMRGEVVPLIRLARLLQTTHAKDQGAEGDSLVVIVEDHGKKFALLVDELLGQSQVVIKNLESNFRKVEGVAGATILGDGRVALILDVLEVVRLAAQGSAESGGYEPTQDTGPGFGARRPPSQVPLDNQGEQPQ